MSDGIEATAVTETEAPGGCFCGAVRYLITGPPQLSVVCHCPDCRRATGAQSVAWLVVNTEQLKVLSGQPRTYISSAGVARTFCETCGTTLTWTSDLHLNRVDVTIGSLDNPNQFAPTRAVYRRHRLSWASEI